MFQAGLNRNTPGLVLICTLEGVITEVLRDEIGLSHQQTLVGHSLTTVASLPDFTKALNFLVELRNRQAAFDWQMNVAVNENVLTLHFAGIVSKNQILIVAAQTNGQIMKLYEELMFINNEQLNTLRASIKEQIAQAQPPTTKGEALYDDISRLNNELINLQRELAKKNAELSLLNEQKNRFLGMASHDLLSPLTIIMAYSEYLKNSESAISEEEKEQMLTTIYNSSEFMLRIVNDFLDLTTIEAGKLELRRSATDIIELIEHNLSLNRVLAARKEIELEFTSPPDTIPPLMIDPHKIEQVLNNFITNAIKFSYPQSKIYVNLEKHDTQIVVSVRDEGQGIPAEEMQHLFKPYGRTSVTSTSGEKSTGLGLTIVRKIIEGHNGKTWADSIAGQSSTFYFSLPLLDASPDVSAAPKPPAVHVEISSAELAQLPADWLNAFTQAVEILDVVTATDMLNQIANIHPQIHDKFLGLLQDFRADVLLFVLKKVKQNTSPKTD